MTSINSKTLAFTSFILFQMVLLALFWIFVRYDKLSLPTEGGNSTENVARRRETDAERIAKYPQFQDINVMIFVGIAFLMTFLHKYGYSAAGYTFVIAAVVVQWAILVKGFFYMNLGFIRLSLGSMIDAEFAAATPLISMGVILGRSTPLQLLLMGILEIPLFTLNLFIQSDILSVTDVGGSITVHAFAAYFGLGVSSMMRPKKGSNEASMNETSNYISDIFAMIGTLFLWAYWPSFNSVLAVGAGAQERAIVNTYLSLTAATVTTFALSALVSGEKKLSMTHVQNSTLAGGVAAGAVCNLLIGSHGAILLGMISAALSVIGYQFLTPAITANIRLHDTCGVHNLHGMPALVSAFASAIYACLVTKDAYKDSMVDIYPAMAKESELFGNSTQLLGGLGRTALQQGGYQLLGIAVTVLIALFGGILTGVFIKIVSIEQLNKKEHHLDEIYWKVSGQEN